MVYFCCDERRRNAVKEHPTLNGIDFLEVSDDPADPYEDRQRTLFVHFLKPLSLGSPPLTSPPAGTLVQNNVLIEGGERIRNIKITDVRIEEISSPPFDSPPLSSPPTIIPANVLVVVVAEPGDFSTYTLRIVRDAEGVRERGTDQDSEFSEPPDGFDPILSAVDFSFKVACPSDFDCRLERVCPTEPKKEPEINYLAKDYSSFRQLMLDRMAVLAPTWKERNPADMGVALVELLAYVGDYLSYQQDAIATESYLGTARLRTSLRRHTKLIDYHMADGRNARVWVHVCVEADNVQFGKGTQILTRVPSLATRIRPPSGSPATPSREHEQALAVHPIVFETIHPANLHQANNQMEFYTWGDDRCCLPKGATRATLKLKNDQGLISIQVGDVLIFVEKRNPSNGILEEANPAHRHAVCLVKVTPATDPLFKENDSNQDVRVVNIQWASQDALPFPLCLWEVSVNAEPLNKQPVSVALGNIVLADHGRTITGEVLDEVPTFNPALTKVRRANGDPCEAETVVPTSPRYRPKLEQRPLTHAATYISNQLPASARAALHASGNPLPAITLVEPGVPGDWEPKRDLLSSGSSDKHFVAEIESDGTAYLRFGDDQLGSRPRSGTKLVATYRIGNGVAGNVGANTLAHIISGEAIKEGGVTNPLPAQGGIELETMEHVRQNAPSAFRRQERAVTPADYEEIAIREDVAERCDIDVQRAAATLRWTGSWHTMFLTIDWHGGRRVDEDFEGKLRRCLERFRMAGQDLEVDAPRPVSLDIEIAVCVKPGYFFSDVQKALSEVFSNRTLRDGRRGLFHPDNFSFGQPVYLSSIFAAAQAVTGVDSLMVTKFQRQGRDSKEALNSGKLELDRLEIARLDNDPNFPEHGVINLIHG